MERNRQVEAQREMGMKKRAVSHRLFLLLQDSDQHFIFKDTDVSLLSQFNIDKYLST